MRSRLQWIKTILLICSVVIIGFGQSSTQNVKVSGRVTDPNKAVIVGASVTLKSLKSKETLNALTNDEGVFVFEVRPGEYQLSAQTLYFDEFVMRISVEGGKNSEFNIALKLHICTDPVKRLSVEEKRTSRNCQVHQERLRLGVVPIEYGLVLRSDGEASGSFPNSNLVYYGGCVVDCYEKAEVLFCQSCRKAELKWNERTRSK